MAERTVLVLAALAAICTGCTTWSASGEARLGGVGFHPVTAGGARLAAAGELVSDPIVKLRLGPDFAWQEQASFGHSVMLSAVPAIRFHTPVAIVVGLELPVGVALTIPERGRWSAGSQGYEGTGAVGPWSARVGLALTLHLDLEPLADVPIAPFIRYDQAVLAPFAPNAGVAVLPTSHLGLGLEIDLPE